MSSKDTTDLIDMYRSYGLSEPFAMAIVEGKDPKFVMEFWNQDWHKQYTDADDVLVIAVLEQTITPEEGEWLNSVRSNHEQLIQACIAGACNVDWARALIDAGFLGHPDLVTDVLKGAEPLVIAQLGGIENDAKLFPPKLQQKWIASVPDQKTNLRTPSQDPWSNLIKDAKLSDETDMERKKIPQISSPQEFMHQRPKNFTVNIGYGIAEFSLAMISETCLTYIATFKKEGILKEVDKVEIYFHEQDTLHLTKRFQIVLQDPVIIYSAGFFSEPLRKAHIGTWPADALIKYCGFRFF